MTWPSDPDNPQYGAPQHGAPQYGAPQYGAPQYGAPQYGGPQYGTPPPPPMPYQQPAYGQAYGQPPKKSRKGLYIALAIVGVMAVVVIAGVVALAVFARNNVVATNAKVGDCIKDVPTDSLILTLPTVDCAEPHGGEVYAILTMPDGEYPGSATIDEWQNKCPAELATFSEEANDDASVGVFVLYPTKQTWDQGDRAVTCIATLDPKRTGTLRG